jgi:hypothetical protein
LDFALRTASPHEAECEYQIRATGVGLEHASGDSLPMPRSLEALARLAFVEVALRV